MFIFLHVPKSAGTTLRSVIEDQHTKPRSWFQAYRQELWDPARAAQEFHRLPPEGQDAVEVFYGHVGYGAHAYLERPVVYYTVLRDPVERAISHYYYVLGKYILPDQRHADHRRAGGGGLTLEEYVLSGYCPEMDNGQTRQFAGEHGLFDRVPFGQCPSALLEEAKRNLRDNIAVVGLTEQFDASLLLIQRLCGWRAPFYVRRNVTEARPRRVDVSPSALAAIQERTQLDRPLYEYGVQLFKERAAAQGPGFNEEVLRFRECNRRRARLALFAGRLHRQPRRAAGWIAALLRRSPVSRS